MKKISYLLIVLLSLIACEGDRGPQGPQGIDGGVILGNVYEINRDLLPQNNYSTVFEFPLDIEVFESDVVLVYLLEEVVNDEGGPASVWTPLPQSFFFDDGNQVVYTYNHTYFDVNIFLDGNVNLDTVPDEFIFNKTFRIAIIPAEFAENNPNLNSYESVMQTMPDAKIIKID
ncbi:hypothetical protein pgond44_05045 [Psychroflexus gondwanensis ACAM 44]|jgi:hypothetical protein|uniref:Dihydrolipoamide dehydrogenase n=1 Tax=Psychroflexus gondwanensis ACAM 44 TaxID=1189619 RepID=N1WXF9_9FLAO|nr:hypothetical protein [Psychroflexus gondwanensis]EMY81882.1 hypothetical protein pgond44_05045 [Psychroflexus gondwanensis ACAM 44]